MNDYKLPIIEPTIDYTKVPPINQKRTISFINHFIIHTVTFLNKFAMSCEEKLFEFENKLQKVEASLEILESWLSSVPELEQDVREMNSTENTKENKSEESEVSKIDEPDNSNKNEPNNQETEEQPKSRDPRYEKYLKMIHFGVPKQAVKLKMIQEGLDSSILDDSQQILSKPQSSDNTENEGN